MPRNGDQWRSAAVTRDGRLCRSWALREIELLDEVAKTDAGLLVYPNAESAPSGMNSGRAAHT